MVVVAIFGGWRLWYRWRGSARCLLWGDCRDHAQLRHVCNPRGVSPAAARHVRGAPIDFSLHLGRRLANRNIMRLSVTIDFFPLHFWDGISTAPFASRMLCIYCI